MSRLICQINTVQEIQPHPDPKVERLEIVRVDGWYCLVRKDEGYKVGDRVLYIPIDSVLPQTLQDHLFADSKIKPENGRIKTVKFRGALSQGLVINPKHLMEFAAGIEKAKPGTDFAERLGIKKYEPPAGNVPRQMLGQVSRRANPHFRKYTDIDNFKHFPTLFAEGEEVYISEKLHGTSFRGGWVPTAADRWWKKVLKLLRLLPKFEFVFGSRNQQLSNQLIADNYYTRRGVGNVYAKMVKENRLKEKLDRGEVLYGEIVGPGIQKGYSYGLNEGYHCLYAYDIMKDGVYMDAKPFIKRTNEMAIPRVPMLHIGKFAMDLANKLREGLTSIDGPCFPAGDIREGVVIKPLVERQDPRVGRVVAKFINDDYLLRDNSEFH